VIDARERGRVETSSTERLAMGVCMDGDRYSHGD
jgi:hypothetical protein